MGKSNLVRFRPPHHEPLLQVDIRPPKLSHGASSVPCLVSHYEERLAKRVNLRRFRPHFEISLMVEHRPARTVSARVGQPFERIVRQERPIPIVACYSCKVKDRHQKL